MDIALASVAFVVAVGCAVAMGFAIQRGATCTVLAVAEVVSQRRFTRLASMVEASLWVLGGLLVARALGLLQALPAGYAINGATVLGGVLLGVGAYVNRACVFGAIARLGSGEWSYVATPIGFFAGCVAFAWLPLAPRPALAYDAPLLSATGWIAAMFTVLVVVRVLLSLRRRGGSVSDAAPLRAGLAARVWSPHAATIAIGVAFVIMLLLVGAWSYTDALAELARGMANNAVARVLLFAGLLGGAIVGGWTAGRLRAAPVSMTQVVRCFTGGALMAFGTLLVPGGNDGLILVAMPLLWPYAWVAFGSMCLAIGLAQVIGRAGRSAPRAPARTG